VKKEAIRKAEEEFKNLKKQQKIFYIFKFTKIKKVQSFLNSVFHFQETIIFLKLIPFNF